MGVGMEMGVEIVMVLGVGMGMKIGMGMGMKIGMGMGMAMDVLHGPHGFKCSVKHGSSEHQKYIREIIEVFESIDHCHPKPSFIFPFDVLLVQFD